MDKVLFEITEDHLETGMRGFPVGYCTTSSIDPIKGLFYRGKAVSELSAHTPEQVIYLLYHGKEGSAKDIKAFSQTLHDRGHCSQAVIRHVQSLPRQGHPMKLFCEALLILGTLESQEDYQEDCLNLIAKIPHLVATVINYHAGWGETPPPSPQLGYMENFVAMLRIPDVQHPKLLQDVFRLFNVLHYDHGGGNLSAFVGKAVASGLEDMYGAIASAMCALAGPRHGKANQDCLEFVQDILDHLGEEVSEEGVEKLLRERLANKELVYGFGHAVLRAEDARASILYEYGEKHFHKDPLIKAALLLRKVAPKVLSENPKVANPYPNVDAISGSILCAAGFSYPEYFTVLFGLSRIVGIAIQIVYERCHARGGKGTPIVRPKYIYRPV
ncbi:MAG: citrate (Si)-synthase [Chlamydiae bacterium]|nr:citrate (Si)-synthase [Chlamydiota bacterium]